LFKNECDLFSVYLHLFYIFAVSHTKAKYTMDHLVFFKENQSFKEIIDQIRLSYTRPYTTYFPVKFEQIAKVLQKSNDLVLFYFAEDLTDMDRIRIKNLSVDHPGIKICLLAHEQFALSAWKLQVFHFEEYPVSASKIATAYKKYVQLNGGEAKELVIKEDGATVKIPFSAINYLMAAGNYTMIHQKNDKTIVQTKQLGTYEYLCEKDVNFNRVHRSLIVNLGNVNSIGNKQVQFYNTTKPLQLSEPLEAKLKREILGK
jgi:hypothetical protein